MAATIAGAFDTPVRPRVGVPEGVVALATFVAQLIYLLGGASGFWVAASSAAGMLLTLVLIAAVLTARAAPQLSLPLLWVAGIAQLAMGIYPQPSQLVMIWIAYSLARYGSRLILALSGISAVLGTLIAAAFALLILEQTPLDYSSYYFSFYGVLRNLVRLGLGGGGLIEVLALVLFVTAPLILPWLVGLVMRLVSRSRVSEEGRVAAEHERADAMRLAAIDAHQARLARDVHDVVGHSLAVILAQAQAGQYLPTEESMRETLSSIASSARRSLGEVRQVLGEMRDGTPQRTPVDGVDALVESLRVSGVDVREAVVGAPRPLPPEVEAVVYRVMQEMATNVLKHGRPGGIVSIEYMWTDGLRVQMRNYVDGSPGEGHGSGIAGMRARLDSVGGSLEVLRYGSDEGEIACATAWVPSGVRA